MRHDVSRWSSVLIGLVVVGSLVAVDPGAIALLNVEFLMVAGSVAVAMTRENVRVLWRWLLISDTVMMLRIGWRMTREDPRCIVSAA